MQPRVTPGIAGFARGGLPVLAVTDDGNRWVDGLCWLYCGQRWTRVLWIGPVSVAGAEAPMYACGPCIQELQERVWQAIRRRDEPSRPVSRAAPDSSAAPIGGRRQAPGSRPHQ
jgi:hypothetical protein